MAFRHIGICSRCSVRIEEPREVRLSKCAGQGTEDDRRLFRLGGFPVPDGEAGDLECFHLLGVYLCSACWRELREWWRKFESKEDV